MNNFELVFGLGPAGTGKSYLAVAKGIDMLKKGLVDKNIILESLIAFKRAGANAIVSYYADRIDKILK